MFRKVRGRANTFVMSDDNKHDENSSSSPTSPSSHKKSSQSISTAATVPSASSAVRDESIHSFLNEASPELSASGAQQQSSGEIRIDIHGQNNENHRNSDITNDNGVNGNNRRESTSSQSSLIQDNFSSLLNQARTQIERHGGDTGRWRVNFSRVVRPLVLQARTINHIRSLMPNSSNIQQYVPLMTDIETSSSNNLGEGRQVPAEETSENGLTPGNNNNNNNYIENSNSNNANGIGYSQPSTSSSMYAGQGNTVGSSNIRRSSSSSSNSPTSPIGRSTLLERVASLTRDDPPDVISASSPRQLQQQTSQQGHLTRQSSISGSVDGGGAGGGGTTGTGGGATNEEEEGAIAEIFAQVPEARRAFTLLIRYIPFVCILLCKIIYDNFSTYCDFCVLGYLFTYSNSLVKQQATKQTQRQKYMICRCLLFIGLVFAFRILNRDIITFKAMILLFPLTDTTVTLTYLLNIVIVTDLMLKLITIGIKLFIILLPPTLINYKGRGRIFALVESISQFYRCLVPVKPWLVFLMDTYTGWERVFGFILTSTYLVAKILLDISVNVKFCKKAVVAFLTKVDYGKVPSKEQIETAGSICPICHDSFDNPVLLECGHIFCELCVGTWFTRMQTCPVCRAKVVEDFSWHDGATTFFIQWC